MDAGAGPDLDEVHRTTFGLGDLSERDPQADDPPHGVRLHQPGSDLPLELVVIGPAEIDQGRPSLLRLAALRTDNGRVEGP